MDHQDDQSQPAVPAWAAGMRLLREQSGGVVGLIVILPEEIPGILYAAAERNPGAIERAAVVRSTVQRFATAPRHEPLLCGSCPRPLKKGQFAIVSASPERPDREHAMIFGICQRCAGTHQQVVGKALDALRRFWPDARPIDLPPEGSAGRA